MSRYSSSSSKNNNCAADAAMLSMWIMFASTAFISHYFTCRHYNNNNDNQEEEEEENNNNKEEKEMKQVKRFRQMYRMRRLKDRLSFHDIPQQLLAPSSTSLTEDNVNNHSNSNEHDARESNQFQHRDEGNNDYKTLLSSSKQQRDGRHYHPPLSPRRPQPLRKRTSSRDSFVSTVSSEDADLDFHPKNNNWCHFEPFDDDLDDNDHHFNQEDDDDEDDEEDDDNDETLEAFKKDKNISSNHEKKKKKEEEDNDDDDDVSTSSSETFLWTNATKTQQRRDPKNRTVIMTTKQNNKDEEQHISKFPPPLDKNNKYKRSRSAPSQLFVDDDDDKDAIKASSWTERLRQSIAISNPLYALHKSLSTVFSSSESETAAGAIDLDEDEVSSSSCLMMDDDEEDSSHNGESSPASRRFMPLSSFLLGANSNKSNSNNMDDCETMNQQEEEESAQLDNPAFQSRQRRRQSNPELFLWNRQQLKEQELLEQEQQQEQQEHAVATRAQYNACIMPNRVFMVRHGQSEGNINERLYSVKPDNAMQLTKLGWQQARAAGVLLRQSILQRAEANNDTCNNNNDGEDDDAMGPKPTSVHFIVSPYVRTVETFHGIVSAWCDPSEFAHIKNRNKRLKAWYGRLLEMGLTWHEDPRIREQDFGNYQNPERIRQAKEERHRFGPFFYRFAHGESASDVFDRVSTFLDSLWRSFDLNKASNYVLVTHGISIRVLLARYFRYTIDQFSLLANPRNCEMVVLAHNGVGKLQLEGRYELELEKQKVQKKKTTTTTTTEPMTMSNGNNKKNDDDEKNVVVGNGHHQEKDESEEKQDGENKEEEEEEEETIVTGYQFHKRLRVLPKDRIHKLRVRISPDEDPNED